MKTAFFALLGVSFIAFATLAQNSSRIADKKICYKLTVTGNKTTNEISAFICFDVDEDFQFKPDAATIDIIVTSTQRSTFVGYPSIFRLESQSKDGSWEPIIDVLKSETRLRNALYRLNVSHKELELLWNSNFEGNQLPGSGSRVVLSRLNLGELTLK